MMNKSMKNENKVLAILGLIFIIMALIIIIITPLATGYELSIYDAYPWYFWSFIFIGAISGIFILIIERKSNWWLLGVCIIILYNIIVLVLPFLRGYYIYQSGDALTHLGSMKDIIATGQIGRNNYYPTTHILGVSILEIIGLNMNTNMGTIVTLLFIIFCLVYLSNYYLLAREITNSQENVPLIMIFVIPTMFSYVTDIPPSLFSTFMIPLLLYIYHRINRQIRLHKSALGEKLLIIVLAFMIIFSHPVTTIFVIGILLIFIISNFISRKWTKWSNMPTVTNYYPSIIMFITFFIWYFSYTDILFSVAKVFNFLLRNNSEEPLFSQQTNLLARAQLSTPQLVELFTYKYGAIFLYIFMSIIAIIIIFKMINLDNLILSYTSQFITAISFSAFSLFGFTGEYNPIRIARFFLVLSPIIIGLTFCRFIDEDSRKNSFKRKITIILIIFVILTVTLLSMLGMYGSPRIAEPNEETTKMDVIGIEWFISHQNQNITTTTIGINIRRFEDLIFGSEYNNRMPWDFSSIASHFGYDKNSSIAKTLSFKDRYLLITKADTLRVKIIPENIRYKAHQYTDKDFVILNGDATINQIYTNGELTIWKIQMNRNNYG